MEIISDRRAFLFSLACMPLASTSLLKGRSTPMTTAPRLLGSTRAQVGEGTWWDPGRGAVWWVDTFGPTVHRTDPVTGDTTTTPLPEMPGGVALASDGRLLLALETALFLLDPKGREAPERLSAPPILPATHRFNDLTVDPRGRLIVGTVKKSQAGPPEPTGRLYSFDGATWRELRTGLYTLNGLAFSPSGDRMYFSDSHPSVNRIWSAPYDQRSGAVGEASTFVDMRLHRGRPDGAAMDRQGGYWIAAIDGSCVQRFTPDGGLDRLIELPVTYPTKPAFGGAGLDRLFVSSLSIRPTADHPERAGALLELETGFQGKPVPAFKLPRRPEGHRITPRG